MAYEDFSTAGPANLSGGLLSGGTSLCIYSGTPWPTNLSGTFRVTVDNEIIRLQGASGFVYPIVERGVEGSVESNHQDYARVIHNITSQGLKNVTGGINRQSGAAYTFGAADARSCVLFHASGVAPVSGALPQTTSGDTSAFGAHFWVVAFNRSSGALNIAPQSGTINGAANLLLDGGANKAAWIFSDGTVGGNYAAIVTVMSGAATFSLTSGCITSGMIGNGAVVSGSVASGQVAWAHLSSGAVRSGHVADAAVNSGNIASGSVGFPHLANASVRSGTIASGQVYWPHLASGFLAGQSGITIDFTAAPPTIGATFAGSSTAASGSNYNYLINGGVDFVQRYSPSSGQTSMFTAVTVNGSGSVDSYSADRWKVGISSGGAALFLQWNRLLSGWVSGATALNYGAWQIGTSGHKLAVYQPIEAVNAQGLANKKILFQALAKSPTSGLLFRIGVLQTNSGVIQDTIPTKIASGYAVGTSGTDPTWGSGVSLLGPASTFQLTTNWQTIFTSGVTGQSGHVNLIPTVWSNDPMSSGVILHMTELGAYDDD